MAGDRKGEVMTTVAQTPSQAPREATLQRRHGCASGLDTVPLPTATNRPVLNPAEDKILYLEHLTVSFDGFKALNDLTLYIDPGELRCIIGPNGAGKTTMMDVITGKTRPDAGTAWFGRQIDLLKLTEPEIAQAGIGRKFQKPTVFEHLDVFENLELALAGDKGFWKVLFARLSPQQRTRIDEVLVTIGLADQRHTMASTLSKAAPKARARSRITKRKSSSCWIR